MASLKDLRNRIASVKATQKITKAMQMVAAAKLRKAQQAAESARPYASRMANVLNNLAGVTAGSGDLPALMAGTGKDDSHLLVVCSAERGLCGGFNSSIAKLAREHARELARQGRTAKFLIVGKKAGEVLKREFEASFVDRIDLSGAREVGYEQASQIGDKILSLIDSGAYDQVHLFFSEFESVISQIPTRAQLFPVAAEGDGDGTVYAFEPDGNELLEQLLPRNLKTQILRALLENAASEQGARMSAMDNATRNAGEMIDSLTLTYNRTRQAMITKELIEIISGAEAL